MQDLIHLSAPWWHFVLRAVLVYTMVMVLIRISGKRSVGQFTPFDLVLLILIGNAVQNGLNGGDNSVTGALVLASTLILLNYGVAFLTSRYRGIEKVVEGSPVVLAWNGEVYHDVLRREFVSEDDFDEALRMNNVSGPQDVGVALLETNGSISVISRQKSDGTPLPRPHHHKRRKRRPNLSPN